ncbi:RnfABCDGE type electron transport complex subunit B [Treponema brennaborense]|uniref:Ion-translocating oxidoreductase complex subunit B n=1 Tax=Treponema brennaborense (strain DSM 12168 / CIP 105900 / DD5/3) TaxID=906968 RepID=F4LJ31_TREBD|nr:RnfABCDGE type electron transport complex subunit B [Treponema brennaborense]AEE16288.1 electron transport complex, RnfABCDGE type, B subunit [Treponema brennaborense DSM 12168]
MTTILITLGISFAIAFILGVLLGFFKKIFYVPVDPTIEKVRSALPGANCGACGYPGCDGFAAAVAAGNAPVDGCAAGGAATAEAVGNIMGVSASAVQQVALLACQGSKEHAQPRGTYNGVKTCRAAKLSINGTKMCSYGCIGFADCVAVCKFDALAMKDDGLPHVDYAKCTGCGMCVAECPQGLFAKVDSARKGAVARCSNRSTNKAPIIKQCKTGCIKCGKCERACPEHALVVTNGIPLVDYGKCTSCGECIKGCPTHVLELVENITAVR